MSEITFKGGKPIPPKPRKKKHLFAKIFWPIFTVIFLLPIATVGVLAFLLYDGTHVKTNIREEYPNEEVFSDIITHSLDYTEEQHKMRIRLTEDALNQVFHNLMYQDGHNSIDVINNLYIKVTNKNYVFGVEIDLYGWYKTRVQMTTKLTVTDEDIVFKLTNIQIGKLSGLTKLASFIIERVKIPDINKIFHDNGFNMTLDLTKFTLTYPKESLLEDLTKVMGSSDNAYTSLFSEMMFNGNFLSIIPNSEKAVELSINLENMRPTNETYNIAGYQMPEGYLDEILAASMSKVKGYLESNTIDVEHAQSIANYYVRGFDYLEDSDKSVVEPYLLSGAISEATNTYDYTIDEDDNLMSIAFSQLALSGYGANYYEVNFTTDQIDRALSQAAAIGTTVLLKAKDENGIYTTNYISVDRLSNVVDDENGGFYIVLSIDFNGYDVALSMKSVIDSDHNTFGQVKFDVENLFIGNEPLTEETKSLFLAIFSSAVEDGAFGDSMTFHNEGENIYLLIDLTSAVEAKGVTEAGGYTTEFELLEQTSTTPGTLRFKAYK